MKKRLTFLLAGLITGIVCVLPGKSPLMLLTLTWGVGPTFFAAVVAGIVITGARRHLHANVFRYIAGLVVCLITYLLALMVFFAVGGFSPDWFGFRPSDNFDQFGMDVALGLLAAGVVAAIGIAFFAFVLTGRWSSFLLLQLLVAGIVTIVVTFIANFPFRNYWSFFGVLLPVGSALYCYLVGTYIWRSAKQPYRTATTG